MKKIYLAGVVCFFSVAAMAAPELTGSPSELSSYLLDARKIIAINGAAETKVEANQATVMLTIKNEARSLDAALQENEKLQRKVNQLLLDGGIGKEKVKAANFSSTPDYGWLKDKPKSYEISREVKVSVSNAAQMRAVARVVDHIDEVFMGTMSFEDGYKSDNELLTLQKALDNIQAKKALYEKSFAVSLALVKVVDQGVRPVYAAPRLRRAMKAEQFSSTMQESNTAAGAVTSGQFAGITYHANAMAEFVVVD